MGQRCKKKGCTLDEVTKGDPSEEVVCGQRLQWWAGNYLGKEDSRQKEQPMLGLQGKEELGVGENECHDKFIFFFAFWIPGDIFKMYGIYTRL